MQADLSSFERVTIPKADLGRKLGYDEALDVITYVNQKAQENPESEQVKSQVQPDAVPFEVPEEELISSSTRSNNPNANGVEDRSHQG